MAKRILVIDDDEDILAIIRIILQEEGFDVILSNTPEAVAHIHEIRPDLILLDIRLKDADKNGAEICEEIKLQYSADELPVILISAEFNLPVLALDCGADGFVAKPFDISELIACIRMALP